MLLLLWCRLDAAAPITPLAWEHPIATGAIKSKKKKKKKNFSEIKPFSQWHIILTGEDTLCFSSAPEGEEELERKVPSQEHHPRPFLSRLPLTPHQKLNEERAFLLTVTFSTRL